MSNRTLGFTIAFVVLAAIAIGGGIYIYNNSNSKEPMTEENNTSSTQNSQNTQQNQTTAQSGPETLNGCTRNFDANKLATAQVDIAGKYVTLKVKGFGDIKVQLYDKDAPKTVENFLRLVNAGYYDCLTFHRVAKGFVIQGGDPTGTGSGGDSAFGGEFADELNPDTASYKAGYVKGVLAMANRGPNTNTSQFFIMIGDVSLPHAYTIFGKVTTGLNVVDKIGAVDITPQLGPTDGAPKTPVVIEKATISSK